MTSNPIDVTLMAQAIAASASALDKGNMPFGAVLVSPAGTVLQVAENNQVTSDDCTGHAELVLVRQATLSLGAHRLKGATVYASGEPCAMCSGAMFWAGISRVVFAASQGDICRVLGGPTLPITSSEVLAGAMPAVEVHGPVLGDEAIAVLQRFVKRC
jgi:tRNA(Arg) A34 adenosine deaminase TadA